MSTSERRMKRGKKRRLTRSEIIAEGHRDCELELRRKAVRYARDGMNDWAATMHQAASRVHEQWEAAMADVDRERGGSAEHE